MAAWRITRTAAALRIEHSARPAIVVGVDGWRFVLSSDGRTLGRFPVQDVRGVGRRVVEALRRGAPPCAYTVALPAASLPHPLVVAGHLIAERQQMLAAMDPRVRAVFDRVAPLAPAPPQLLCSEAMHRDAFVVSDVLAYPAAAIALAFVETALRPADLFWDAVTAKGEAALLEAIRNWRGLFSPDGRPYRSLDRTLMQLPAGVPPDLLCELRHVRLERPVVDRLELTTLLLAHRVYRRAANAEVAATHLRAIACARAPEIVAAVRRTAAAVARRLAPGRIADLEFVLRLLADYPRPGGRRLAALVERALRWHRVAPDVREELQAAGGLSAPTVRPPVPLPGDPRIAFLDTMEAVVREGERMRHCVATYARAAARGECFLFHVRHRGAEATVEVGANGVVLQASGPCNQDNAAARWGRRRLAAWGAALLPAPVRRRRAREAEARRRRRARAALPQPEQLAFWPAPG
jgi:hypothetical protein